MTVECECDGGCVIVTKVLSLSAVLCAPSVCCAVCDDYMMARR